MPNLYRNLVASASYCFFLSNIIHMRLVSSRSSVLSGAPVSSALTCPYRTVNFVTHTLPQQCLKTSWAAANVTHSIQDESPSTILQLVDSTSGPSPVISDVIEGAKSAIRLVQDGEEALQDTVIVTISGPQASPTFTVSSSQPSTTFSSLATSFMNLDAEPEYERESPLDNVNFLSFEDWKKQNLASVGQSPEHVGNNRPSSNAGEPRRRPGSINNALDSLGEDTEIDLDFDGFVGSGRSQEASTSQRADTKGEEKYVSTKEDVAVDKEGALRGSRIRSKDAGKTYKERFNYASFDCAATVLKTNPQCKGTNSILVENKDSYMLNECSALNKFIIIELCDDILVDTVVLANYEFFSSMFRTFRVSVSDRYPVKLDRWRELGVFEARNSREVQAFLIENSLIWARYLRVEFLAHYGAEYYCPISLLRVHGTTMMDEFRHQEEVARGDEDPDEDGSEGIADEGEKVVPEAIAVETVAREAKKAEAAIAESVRRAEDVVKQAVKTEPEKSKDSQPEGNQGVERMVEEPRQPLETTPMDQRPHQIVDRHLLPFNTFNPICRPVSSNPEIISGQPGTLTSADGTCSTSSLETISKATETSASHSLPTTIASSSNVESHRDHSMPASKAIPKIQGSPIQATPLPTTESSIGTVQEASKTSSSVTHPPAANPTTQESFFKTIHKRLQLLESNSTLSLQYIEEQSRILRDAFTKVEKRQMTKTATFLENLNLTLLAELQGFRQQYDQIWQSTVIELENQREQSQREIVAVSTRLSLLADEMIIQRRLSMVLMFLILLCLVLVIFSRGAASNYLELPTVQSMVARSQDSFRSASYSAPGSPNSTRPNSSQGGKRSYGMFGNHWRHRSEDSRNGARSPTLEFSPPTPTSDVEHSDLEESARRSISPASSGSPEASIDPQAFRGTQSSPATPSGSRKMRKNPLSWHEVDFVQSSLLRPDHSPDSGRKRSPLRTSEERANDFEGKDQDEEAFGGFSNECSHGEGGGSEVEPSLARGTHALHSPPSPPAGKPPDIPNILH
ncbi:MAG: hypothetical protein M1827_000554 [Pycnora praestabilis]|nr:MAG: hypothetical protein M1827_000554 [Pycnora praestabilis]